MCAWVWSQPLEYWQPPHVHTPREEWYLLPIASVGMSAASTHVKYLTAWSCLGLVWVTTEAVRSWVQWPCHAQKMAFQSTPVHPPALRYFLLPFCHVPEALYHVQIKTDHMKNIISQAWWCMPVSPALGVAEEGRPQFECYVYMQASTHINWK